MWCVCVCIVLFNNNNNNNNNNMCCFYYSCGCCIRNENLRSIVIKIFKIRFHTQHYIVFNLSTVTLVSLL